MLGFVKDDILRELRIRLVGDVNSERVGYRVVPFQWANMGRNAHPNELIEANSHLG